VVIFSLSLAQDAAVSSSRTTTDALLFQRRTTSCFYGFPISSGLCICVNLSGKLDHPFEWAGKLSITISEMIEAVLIGSISERFGPSDKQSSFVDNGFVA
jgi:hypothetical protein